MESRKVLNGRKYLEKLSMIDNFLSSVHLDRTYTLDDIRVNDLTNTDLKYIKEVCNFKFKHVCGVIKFYENEF